MIIKPIHENDPRSAAAIDMLRADHALFAANSFLVAALWVTDPIEHVAMVRAAHALRVLAEHPDSQCRPDRLSPIPTTAETVRLSEPATLDLIAQLYDDAANNAANGCAPEPLWDAADAVRRVATALRARLA
jgi:hypothetical protein